MVILSDTLIYYTSLKN
ncbi:hypothetical protein [Chitinophaga agrisoli]